MAESLLACEALLAAGARQIFFKYCSTFDSTDEGNIGPVADALLEAAGVPLTVVCPTSPEHGRTGGEDGERSGGQEEQPP